MTHATFAPLERMLDEHLRRVSAFAVRLAVLGIAFVLALGWASGALAAPRASSAEECFAVADMTITARALAEEKVPYDTALAVLGRMYPAATVAKWALAVVQSAYADKRSAKDLAMKIYEHCAANQGNMDGFLGVAL